MLRTALLTALFLPVALIPARAADPSPQGAMALEAQLRSWMQGMAGPGMPVPARPVQVLADGDHYVFTVPVGVAKAPAPAPVIQGTAKAIDGGRWSFEGPYLPSPFTFVLDMPVPPKEGQKNSPVTVPVTYTVTGSGSSQGVFDPSLATASNLTTNSRTLKIVAKSALIDQQTDMARSDNSSTLRPAGAGRVDFVSDGTIEGYTLRSKSSDLPATDLKIERARIAGSLLSVSRERAAQMIPALVGLTAGAMAGAPKAGSKIPPGTPSVDPQLIRALVQSLQDFASEFTIDETLDGVSMAFGGSGGSASQVRIGLGAKSDGKLMAAHMDFGLDGLALPDLGLGAMAGLLPHKVTMRPSVTGVPIDELMKLLSDTSMNSAGPPPEFMAMLGRGTLGAGLDSFSFDTGGATFAGSGRVTMPTPDTIDGKAQITATNFDALSQKLASIPDLASVMPVVFTVKGMAKTVENRLVWDITYSGSSLMVNGNDVSAMMGGSK